MIPKTEPAEHIPKSTLPLSMDSIVKDLRILEKSYISSRERGQNQLNIMQTNLKRLELENSKSKTELEDMKLKIKLLEEQKSNLKSDLEASDLDKNLYYSQYQEIGRNFREANLNISKLKKEVQQLKIENESLKAEMILSKSSKFASESNPSLDLAVVDDPPEWTRSKLSMDEESSDATNDRTHDEMKNQLSSRQAKRNSISESENDLQKSKKPCPEPITPLWNCNICSDPSQFVTKPQLQDHIKQQHPLRAWFCDRCPFTASKKSGLVKHQKLHAANELKFKDTENASKCNLCNVWFPPGSSLANHKKLYHCSNKHDACDKNGSIDLTKDESDEDESENDFSILCPLAERRGNVIQDILEVRFWPNWKHHGPDRFRPRNWEIYWEKKYLIKWKKINDEDVFDDTWEYEEYLRWNYRAEFSNFLKMHSSNVINRIYGN